MKAPLFLASKSPRRKELLKGMGIRFQVHVPTEAEKTAPNSIANIRAAKNLVHSIAKAKAEAAFRELTAKHAKGIILAADTLVFLDKAVLGKPQNRKDAAQMLKSLSGNTHSVVTAVYLLEFFQRKTHFSQGLEVITKVQFRTISKSELTWYLNTDEPYDKAGAYGAQGMGASFIQKITGSYSNVVGLPLSETLKMLGEVSAAPWQN